MTPATMMINKIKIRTHHFRIYSSISNMRRLFIFVPVVMVLGFGAFALPAYAQQNFPASDLSSAASTTTVSSVIPDNTNDVITYIKAQVTQVLSQSVEQIPGTNTSSPYQTINARLLE